MIFLALGSNLSSSFGDRFANINLAISHLEDNGIQIIKKSNFYETYSYPNKENPKFINIVISIKTQYMLISKGGTDFISKATFRGYKVIPSD